MDIVDRLYVPLTAEAYGWYKSGGKRYELRKHGRQFREKYVYTGRLVQLRRGHSGESTWGAVGEVIVGTIEEIFSTIDYRKIIPIANSREEAIRKSKEFGLDNNTECIAFEVLLE